MGLGGKAQLPSLELGGSEKRGAMVFSYIKQCPARPLGGKCLGLPVIFFGDKGGSLNGVQKRGENMFEFISLC